MHESSMIFIACSFVLLSKVISIHFPINNSLMPLIQIDLRALLTVTPSGSNIPSL
jgi:hypothetical protein